MPGIRRRSVVLLVGLVAVLVWAASGSADTVINPFAGNWNTFGGKGTLRLQAVDATKGQTAVKAYGGASASCPGQTVYYTGAYSVPSGDSGQLAGCTSAAGRQLMAWYKSGAGPQNGTINVTAGSGDTTFSGTYHEQSDNSGGSYDGTFTGDFPNSGRTQPPPPPNNPPPNNPPPNNPPPGSPPPGSSGSSRCADKAVTVVQSTSTVPPNDVDVVVIHADGTTEQIGAGFRLCEGDRIRTGYRNTATLDFGGKATVVVDEVTEWQIAVFRLGHPADMELWLKTGGLAAQVAKQTAERTSFRIQTPTTTTSARGSAMTVHYDPATQVGTVTVTQDKATVQPLAFRTPPSSGFGSWTPGPPTAAPTTLLKGESLQVGTAGVIASDLSKAIPAARVLHAGPLSATVPGSISLATLAHSRCLRVEAAATKKARGSLKILAGKKVFGARSLRFKRAGSQVLCLAKTRYAKRLTHRTKLHALTVTLTGPRHKIRRGRILLHR